MRVKCDGCNRRVGVKRTRLADGNIYYWCRRPACEALSRLRGGHEQVTFETLFKAYYGKAIIDQLKAESPLLKEFGGP